MSDISIHDEHSRSRLMFDPGELHYDFGQGHPFQSRRLLALMDLLGSSGLLNSKDERLRLPLRPATLEELYLIHAPDYVAAVQQLSIPEAEFSLEGLYGELTQRYGFAEGDTPTFPDMHEAAARIAGGTLVALSAVMGLPEGGTFATADERPLHVFHPAGGLHHAWAERASGFCIYNDAAVAIAHILRASEAKVLYIDFDAHHGDGVQRAFYDEPRVMTVSFHETGRYLFPGTGDVLELGNGAGRGYSVNIPLEPFTEDDSFTEVMNAVLPPLVLLFAPAIIISQHGCDSHAWDPLAHLVLTLHGIQAQMQLAHQLAHTYCAGRWVALGGGGYDQFRVVPRAWSILWAEMLQQPLPEQLPEAWIARWRPEWERVAEQEGIEQQTMGKNAASMQFPMTFQDVPEDFPPKLRRAAIAQTNHRTAMLIRHLLLPASVRKAFAPSTVSSRLSPMTGLFDLLHVQNRETSSRSKTIETARGPVLLRDFCPPSLIERLVADPGLHAFARVPEREHQLLLNIAQNPDCVLTVAHTPAGNIVGQVTLAFGDEWWEGLENTYEVTVEVSSQWRSVGLARTLLAFALELDTLEDMILFAMGLSWHWDYEGLGLSPFSYRKLIARLFASQGFTEQATTEPDIRMEPANILLVRVGSRVNEYTARHFFNRIRSSPQLSHL